MGTNNPAASKLVVVSSLGAAVAAGLLAPLAVDGYGRQLAAQFPLDALGWQPFRYTTAQTGTNVWTPASGKKIVLTSFLFGSGGTTQARFIAWFGASGDTTYTAGTDQLVCDFTFTPTANGTPGALIGLAVPVPCQTADYCLKITTDAALTVGGVFNGLERG